MTDEVTGPDEQLLALLERERAGFLAAVERVPARLRGRHLVDGAWSIAEVMEHVARNDRGVARIFGAAAAGKLVSDPAWTPMGAPLSPETVRMVRERSVPWQAPEVVQPSGVEATVALEELAQARAALLDACRTATPAMLDGASYPHPYLGLMTLRAWMEFIAHHDARHSAQIEELATHGDRVT